MAITNTLLTRIQEGDRLYDDADPHWFDLLDDNVVVYAINHTEPYRSKAAYEKHFAPILERSARKTTILSRDTQVFGNTAVVAQTLQITEGDIVANIRQSVIWLEEEGTWLIKHLHSALIDRPMPASIPKNAKAVTVLNERIATISAVLGVAQ